MINDPGWLYWQQQTVNNCVEESSRIVLTEIGHKWSESTIDNWASAQGWYVPDLGTSAPAGGWVRLLHHFGAPHAAQFATGVPGLRRDLSRHRYVVAVVSAEAIWYGTPGPADHAVVVDSVTSNSVTLTDTGIAGGARETISLTKFKQAWQASGGDVAEVWK